MSTSKYIARLIGPLFLIMGLGMVVEGDTVRALSLEFLGNLSLIYLAGMLALVAGLAIVNAHNLWVADWRIIVTILGWLAVIGGIVRLLFPGKVQSLGAGVLSHPHSMIIGGIVVLALGAILSWVGYEHLWAEPARKPAAKARTARKSAPAAIPAAKASTKSAAKSARVAARKTARKSARTATTARKSRPRAR
jgi:hypothetical protein